MSAIAILGAIAIDGRIIRAMGNGNIGASDRTVYQLAR